MFYYVILMTLFFLFILPWQLNRQNIFWKQFLHLGDEVVLEVAVGAGSIERSPVDIHWAALVLTTLSSAIYDHVHKLGEAGLAIVFGEPFVNPVVAVLHKLVLICRHNPSLGSSLSVWIFCLTFQMGASQCCTEYCFVTYL